MELEELMPFEVKETMHGEVKWYSLELVPSGYTFISSPNKDKILNFKRKIKELHSDKRARLTPNSMVY